MKTAQYIQQLNKIESDALKAMQLVAEDIRKNVLIPYCEKHNLDYCSGMGTSFFTTLKGDHIEIEDASIKLGELLSKDVLREWIAPYIASYNSTQGHYATYTKSYSKHDKLIGV